MSESLQISRWETVLSDVQGLYFVRMVDDPNRLVLQVRDKIGAMYEVLCRDPGPYRVRDEQFLLDYWEAIEAGCGWTFRVEGATWFQDMVLLDNFGSDPSPYVIATYDRCLEVLAIEEPAISRI